MLDAMTSPANSNPVATTEVECASKPMMILLHARMPLTPMPARATRRAVRYDSSTTVTASACSSDARSRRVDDDRGDITTKFNGLLQKAQNQNRSPAARRAPPDFSPVASARSAVPKNFRFHTTPRYGASSRRNSRAQGPQSNVCSAFSAISAVFLLCRRFKQVEVTPETLQKVDARRKATQAVLGHRPPQQLPEADRFVALRCRGRETVRNRLEQPLEPLRLDAPENLLPEHEIPQRPDGFRRVRVVDDFLEQLVARSQRARRRIEDPAIVQRLQQVVRGEDRFGVRVGRLLDLRAQYGASVDRRRGESNGLGHVGRYLLMTRRN